jgi:hypothetical protein
VLPRHSASLLELTRSKLQRSLKPGLSPGLLAESMFAIGTKQTSMIYGRMSAFGVTSCIRRQCLLLTQSGRSHERQDVIRANQLASFALLAYLGSVQCINPPDNHARAILQSQPCPRLQFQNSATATPYLLPVRLRKTIWAKPALLPIYNARWTLQQLRAALSALHAEGSSRPAPPSSDLRNSGKASTS